ncbi:MAG: Sua5/YciO/YrdC/YwlC family protein, partial [Muribaculaceae bacterium]
SVGIRISQEEFSNKLCREFRKPIVSTSANISGEPSATKFSEISEDIKKEVDYIVKYRQNDEESHVASSIIMLSSDGTIKILRS